MEKPEPSPPPFSGRKGVCVECGKPLVGNEYFTCTICSEKVCVKCGKAHIARCMLRHWGGETLPGEKV